MKKIAVIILSVLMLVLAGCSAAGSDTSFSVADAKGNSLAMEGNIVKITSPGTYTVTGTAAEVQIIVESPAEGDVIIVLNGTEISSSVSAPIYVKEADKTIIRLAANTENIVTDNRSRVEEDPNAAIFSHDDLKITGGGKLIVNGNKNNGITSKDKLTIEGGEITVNSENHGLRGKDRLKVEGGTITVNAGYDGLRATNDTEADRGEVLIEGGIFNITAGDDAIYAYNMVNIAGGAFVINTDNNAIKAENSVTISGGTFEITTDDKDFSCGNVSVSADIDITVNGEKQNY